jgi:hypothetical protein
LCRMLICSFLALSLVIHIAAVEVL